MKKHRTAVKICGITRAEDAISVVAAGANALGLVFYPPSKRNVSIEQAREICRVIPPFVSIVGLFVDAEKDWVDRVLASVPLSLLQFHGNESPKYCESFNRPYIKAFKFKMSTDAANENQARLAQAVQEHGQARGLLLDVYDEHEAGGTGRQFDWHQVPQHVEMPIILAGGLNPNNVAEAVQLVKPYAVDVSSGVEQSAGIKSEKLVGDFISATHTAL